MYVCLPVCWNHTHFLGMKASPVWVWAAELAVSGHQHPWAELSRPCNRGKTIMTKGPTESLVDDHPKLPCNWVRMVNPIQHQKTYLTKENRNWATAIYRADMEAAFRWITGLGNFFPLLFHGYRFDMVQSGHRGWLQLSDYPSVLSSSIPVAMWCDTVSISFMKSPSLWILEMCSWCGLFFFFPPESQSSSVTENCWNEHCNLKILISGDFPGSPVVKTPCSHCRGHRFYPWLGN